MPVGANRSAYRASIDMTATAGTIKVDQGKRNELYSMLREEVLDHIKQTEVSKTTILGARRRYKKKKEELRNANRTYQILYDEKESILETNKNLHGEIKDLELQIEDL